MSVTDENKSFIQRDEDLFLQVIELRKEKSHFFAIANKILQSRSISECETIK